MNGNGFFTILERCEGARELRVNVQITVSDARSREEEPIHPAKNHTHKKNQLFDFKEAFEKSKAIQSLPKIIKKDV